MITNFFQNYLYQDDFNKIPGEVVNELTRYLRNFFDNEELLKKVLVELERKPDLFIFGQEIIKEIKNYGVKEIYCLMKFKEKITSKIGNEFLNFKWILFPNNFDGLNNYQGIFGKKYFSI